MKRLLFLAATLIAVSSVPIKTSAQSITVEDESSSIIFIDGDGSNVMDVAPEEDNSYRFRVSGYEISISEAPEKSAYHPSYNHFTALGEISLGFSTLLNTDYSNYTGEGDFMELNVGKSIEVNWGVLGVHFGFGNRLSGISSGLNLVWNNYVFANQITLTKDANGVLQPTDITSDGYRKSKLTTFGLRVPLSVELYLHKYAFLSIGVYGQATLKSYTKVKYPVDKHYNMPVNPFSYGFSARLGFGSFSIYADYTMTPLFRDGRGPKTNTLTIGLGLGF